VFRQAVIQAFQELPRSEKLRIIRRTSVAWSDGILRMIIREGWNSQFVEELEQHAEVILEALVRTVDLKDDLVSLLYGACAFQIPQPRTVVVRMHLPEFRKECPRPGGLRISDLAVTSACLVQLYERYRLAVIDVPGAEPELEPFVSVQPGSISFSLSASGFGTGVLLVALALSGATLPIAAPAWAIAVGGLAIVGPSAAHLIADLRKTWNEGGKASAEAEKAREEAAKLRWERENAEREARESRRAKVGVAELLGIPAEEVHNRALHFNVQPATAYHLINSIGPTMIDAANNGIMIEVTG
jgi:hypothetical protein